MKALVLELINNYPMIKELSPIPSDNSENVTVDIHAASINHRDLWITKGMYPGIKEGIILGSDGCGVYNENEIVINPGINWGDNEVFQSPKFEVLGMPSNGTFSEQLTINKKNIYNKPTHLSTIEASALPLAGVTAYRAVIIKAKTSKNDTVFISGIGGGVSLFAFQYAIALGCRVFVSSSSQDKIDRAINMGAIGGVLYTDNDFAKELLKKSGGIDVVIDSAGGDGFSTLVYACNPGARMVFYGGTRGKINGLNPQIIFWRQISIMGTTMGSDSDFQGMLDFINKYNIVPIIDSVFSINNVNDAFDRMKDGLQFGKIVFDLKLL